MFASVLPVMSMDRGVLGLSKNWRVLQKTLWELSARSRAAAAGARLAPGRLTVLADDPRHDQGFLMERAREFGPVFKVWMPHKLTTCIVGHALARRFLSEHEGSIRVATPDLSPLFPHGFLRGLEGAPHKIYRKRFVEAFRATPIQLHNPMVRQAIRSCFASIADAPQPVGGTTIRRHLMALTTDLICGSFLASNLARSSHDAWRLTVLPTRQMALSWSFENATARPTAPSAILWPAMRRR